MSEEKAPYQTSARSLLEKLGKPFPREAIKQREGGRGKMLDYVEFHTVVRRLNDATGGIWDFQVLNEAREGDLLKATCRLTIPGLGSREHVGVQKVSERGGEDLHKGAISDALKKCAAREPWHDLKRYADDQAAGRDGDDVLRIHDKLKAIAARRKTVKAPAGHAG